MRQFDELRKLQAKVGAMEYLIKFLLSVQFEKTNDPIGNASGFAELMREKMEANRPDHIDFVTYTFISEQLGEILDDLVGEMKRERDN